VGNGPPSKRGGGTDPIYVPEKEETSKGKKTNHENCWWGKLSPCVSGQEKTGRAVHDWKKGDPAPVRKRRDEYQDIVRRKETRTLSISSRAPKTARGGKKIVDERNRGKLKAPQKRKRPKRTKEKSLRHKRSRGGKGTRPGGKHTKKKPLFP